MLPNIQSDGAQQMIKYQNLLDKVLALEPEDTLAKERLAKKQRIKISAPELPQAGLREPKIQ